MKRPFALLLALALSGCGLYVEKAFPRPNVALAEAKSPSKLVLGPQVLNVFDTPGSNAIGSVSVTDWRTTLEIGFHNAWLTGKSGNTLELVMAELTFAPAAVNARGGAVAVAAQVRYKARLLDPAGQEVGIVAGTAEAKQAITSKDELSENAGAAVETMYEKLAVELLGK